MTQRRPSEILQMPPDVQGQGNAFVLENFLNKPVGTGLGADVIEPLVQAWEAGKPKGRPIASMNTQSSALLAQQATKPQLADVPGARVRARNLAPPDRGGMAPR